jgi:hypothetical protein
MCRPKTNRGARLIAGAVAAIGFGASIAGCSDIYLDRRDTVALSGGDAVAANEITQMVDPWPASSAQRNIGFNGQKMQSAVERYRTDRVIPPLAATTSVIDAPVGSAAPSPTGTQTASSGTSATAGTPAQ